MLSCLARSHIPKHCRPFSSQVAPLKILVVGGNGYVGSTICRIGVERGLQVAALSRGGRLYSPAQADQPWAKEVTWLKGDVMDRDAWRAHLCSDTTAVISSVGAFGSNAFMEQVCGDTNIAACEEAAAAHVPRFVFVSAHDYRLIGHGVGPLKGYFNGKRRVERRVRELYPSGGHVLQPSFVYGTRHHGTMKIPLGLVGAPLEALCALAPVKALARLPILDLPFTSPVSVEAVARTAIKGAVGELEKPVLTVDDILQN